MTLGTNLLCDVWEFSYDLGAGDDDVGGAQPSGTVSYYGAQIRLRTDPPTQALLEQGLESRGDYTAHMLPRTVPVKFNNQIVITSPGPHQGQFFRVVGEPLRPSMSPSDSRGYLILKLKRVEKGRTIQ